MITVESGFGDKKIWCHQHSDRPIRFIKACPCGTNYECPICGFGIATLPHKCKLIRIEIRNTMPSVISIIDEIEETP